MGTKGAGGMRKLHSERGESILMALAMVLLATAVAAVILSAAVTAYRRQKNDRQAQQDYLTVSSAAQLVRDEILKASYRRETQVELRDNGDGTTTRVVVGETVTPVEGLLAGWLAAGLGDGAAIPGCTDTIRLEVEAGEGGVLRPVQVQFAMDTQANVTAYVSLVDGSAGDCRLTLTLTGQVETQTDPFLAEDGSRAELVTVTARWNGAKITKGF